MKKIKSKKRKEWKNLKNFICPNPTASAIKLGQQNYIIKQKIS